MGKKLLLFIALMIATGPARPTLSKPHIKKKGAKVQNKQTVISDKPDDPSIPLSEAWQKRLEHFLSSGKPAYGSFVAVDLISGEIISIAEYASNSTVIPHPSTSNRFPAASVFKIITAFALLEEKAATSHTTTCYNGGSRGLEEVNIRDNPKKDKYCLSLLDAFAHSTNAVFGKLAIRHLDREKLQSYAEKMGFNSEVRVGRYITKSISYIPSTSLDLARMGAGFVNSFLSPLHGAVIAAIIARGGTMPPNVTFSLEDGTLLQQQRIMSEETADELKKMMKQTTISGTARKHLSGLMQKGVLVAVKTGTLTSRDNSGLLNTWMVGFFPADKPEIAFAAHVANKGMGRIKAGNLVRFAVETYYKLKRARSA